MKTKVINTEYDIGDKVYLITDVDQKVRIITAIKITPNSLLYSLSCDTTECYHYDIEISREKTIF